MFGRARRIARRTARRMARRQVILGGGASAETGSPDVSEELRGLAALRDDGVLTEEEFEARKQRLIES